MKIKIYYHHTDCGGVVYYANYLDFMEEARTEFLEDRGIYVKELLKAGVLFVVAHQEIDYKIPLVYGDTLDIKARLTAASRVKLEFEYDVKNQNGAAVFAAKTVIVCVGADLKPRPMPDEIRVKIGD